MRVLLIAPFYDRNIPGESWSTYKWVQGISELCDTTILTTHRRGWSRETSPVRSNEIVDWVNPQLPARLGRLNRELKPTYFLFYMQARRWLKAQIQRGRTFDIIHQINPLALRYPCPARGLGLSYIIGPLAGSLETPAGFRHEARESLWYRRLRVFDRLRLRYDPWLRSSYRGAKAILGVAPYVGELLALAGCRRFILESETGIETVSAHPKVPNFPGKPMRVLFVGRIIRTKGILDAIRAVAKASKHCSLHLDVVGDGDLLDECQQEAKALGVESEVCFHGRLPQEEVFRLYEASDVFLFPSFREPSGNVVFEAMSRGMPTITSDRGGPAYVVTEECGIKVSPDNPEQYVVNLAAAIESIFEDPVRYSAMSLAALNRMKVFAAWKRKIPHIVSLYGELLAGGES